MRSPNQAGVVVVSPPTAFRTFLSLAAVLCLAGCSAERMPLAPSSNSFGRSSGAATSWKKDIVAVTLAPGQDAATVAADHGTTVNGNGWRVAGLDVPPGRLASDLIAELVLDPRIDTAELDSPVETAESRQKSWSFDDGLGSPIACATQPATTSCNLPVALQVSRGQGVLVAVLDTGAELTHPMLQGHIAGGWDFVDDDADPSEGSYGVDMDGDGLIDEARGHGTFVAGEVSVVAPDAQLLIVRVLDSEGRGSMANVARGIRWAVANGARVVNLSLGGYTKSNAVELALTEASAAGVACVAAAGNDAGPIPAEYPATSHYATAVAAIDTNDVVAPFSSFGDWVDICAPGVNVRSSFVNAGFALWSGTSMSAPWVSGGVALVLSANPGMNGKQAVGRLNSTARNIWKMNNGIRSGLGSGALDLGAALTGF
jgi:subtilisin family serine protease